MTGVVRAVGTVDDVLRLRPHDEFLRVTVDPGAPLTAYTLAPEPDPGTGVGADPAVGVVRRFRGRNRTALVIAGTPGSGACLLGALAALPDGPLTGGVDAVLLPRATRCLIPSATYLDSWDWMWAARPPARQPGEEAVTPVEEADVERLLDVAGTATSRRPGHPSVAGWMGIAGRGPDGVITACAAYEWHRPGLAHLSAITTHPTRRRRGVGAAVTAAVTRHLFRDGGAEAVTLGVYDDNATARRLYERLGLTVGARFDTWSLTP